MNEADRSFHQRAWAWLCGRKTLSAAGIFALLSLLMFNDALIDSTIVVGAKASDLTVQFLPWRKFGFDELSRGNLALWNPHIFGGAPYFAGFQSALLYPPNWLHLFLPVGLAINWINALHVFAAGFFTNLWCRSRGLSFAGSILAGSMFMFSGAYFLHIYAGHLPHLAVMVWAPLLFLAIDLNINRQIIRGTLLGVMVMAMFLLAGHPQYVYYTGLAAIAYVALHLFRFADLPRGLLGCACIVAGGISLAAIQLLPGVDAASESVRSGGVDYKFATAGSFPPENILTTIAPNVYGEPPMRSSKIHELVDKVEIYFGRSYIWESSLFVSVTGLILAIYGSICGPIRQTRSLIIVSLLCLLLALGAHTPLHRLLYDYLPGFANFRGASKFIYLVALFLSLLAAYGFDCIVKAGRIPRSLLVISGTTLVAAIGLSVTAGSVASSERWTKLLRDAYKAAEASNDLFINIHLLDAEQFQKFAVNAGHFVSSQLVISALVTGVVLAILLVARARIACIYLLILLAITELFFYAASTCAVIAARPELPESWHEPIDALDEHGRIMGMNYLGNMGMWFNYNDGWGYDPGVLKRYAEFIVASQDQDPDTASQNVVFHQTHFNMFPLLRVKYVLIDHPTEPIIPSPPPMSLAELVPDAMVVGDRDKILSILNFRAFDPRRQVLLESEPAIKPAGSSIAGEVKIIDQSTDHIELIAETSSNAILLITNAYSDGWRVKSIGQTRQENYAVIPCNWALQGVALQAGKHHLKLEYLPRSFVIGKWISIFSFIGYLGVLVWWGMTNRKRSSEAVRRRA